MAKKGAAQSPKAGSKPKSPATNNQSKKQKTDRRKSNEVVVEKVEVEEQDEEWVDEEDAKPAPKANGRKANKKQPKVEVEVDELSEEDGDSDDSEDDGVMGGIDIEGIDESDSDSELDSDDGQENEEDEDIDVDELSAIDEEDEEQIAAGTRVRQTINNKEGLLAALRRIALPSDPKTVPFAFHQTVVSSKLTEESIPSIEDDLERELAFMNQSLEAARQGRALLRKENVPFTRPTDYFAETVRSDETMEKVKAKMVEEATAKKASAEARKQRDLKKFGKQVQVQKQQERAKQKRDTLDKIKDLKRKRQDGGSAALGATEVDDLFDVAVDNELGNSSSKKRSAPGGGRDGPNSKRQKKDSKFGFGGKKRFAKSNDAKSAGDLSGFSAKRMKSGGSGDRDGPRGGGGGGGGGGPGGAKKKFVKPTRPGKGRRQSMASKR
ncbi:Ebp2-domain-containing protein [Trichocladium antarcticum]|uniref:Ebp2-domain-containing protein n=1 Tax=Trichocladium antarcticum TaxID=1450529 RepID=A0AAN6US62_9PEZI|nr:Ebp2-domain-containing protein [Trichocladium antarcticum]